VKKIIKGTINNIKNFLYEFGIKYSETNIKTTIEKIINKVIRYMIPTVPKLNFIGFPQWPHFLCKLNRKNLFQNLKMKIASL